MPDLNEYLGAVSSRAFSQKCRGGTVLSQYLFDYDSDRTPGADTGTLEAGYLLFSARQHTTWAQFLRNQVNPGPNLTYLLDFSNTDVNGSDFPIDLLAVGTRMNVKVNDVLVYNFAVTRITPNSAGKWIELQHSNPVYTGGQNPTDPGGSQFDYTATPRRVALEIVQDISVDPFDFYARIEGGTGSLEVDSDGNQILGSEVDILCRYDNRFEVGDLVTVIEDADHDYRIIGIEFLGRRKFMRLTANRTRRS